MLADAIRRGKDRVEVTLTDNGISVSGVYADSTGPAFQGWQIDRIANSVIPVVPAPTHNGTAGPVTGASGTLHQAVEDYAAHVRKTKIVRTHNGTTTSAWGNVLALSVKRLKASHADISLSQFGYSALEAEANYWKARPNRVGTHKPISVDTVISQLKALRMFTDWLDSQEQYKWREPRKARKPMSYRRKLPATSDETGAKARGPKLYTIPELAAIYGFATDQRKLFLLLGLNCAFAQAEIASLCLDEIDLKASQPTIKRIRRKSGVYGEFNLWPETAAALRVALASRPIPALGCEKVALLTSSGNQLMVTTAGNNRGDRVASEWGKLLSRVQKRHSPTFRRLSFKHIRETATDLVRKLSDGETSEVFSCHGQSVEGDKLAEVYSERDFGKVQAALAKVRAKLQPVFDWDGHVPTLVATGDH